MRTLLILRHAKSSWKYDDLADHDRPLKKRGKQDAEQMGKYIEKKDLIPDHIISSTAARAQKTAKIIADACGYDGGVDTDHALYMASPEDIIRILRREDDHLQRIMIVGHNPGLEELLEELTENADWLPTCALAHIKLPIASWSELNIATSGELISLWVPRQL